MRFLRIVIASLAGLVLLVTTAPAAEAEKVTDYHSNTVNLKYSCDGAYSETPDGAVGVCASKDGKTVRICDDTLPGKNCTKFVEFKKKTARLFDTIVTVMSANAPGSVVPGDKATTTTTSGGTTTTSSATTTTRSGTTAPPTTKAPTTSAPTRK
jgi:hypothetical protein